MSFGSGCGGLPAFRGERFHVSGNLMIWLSGCRLDESKGGTAGWLSTNFGFFRKQVESITVSEFVIKLSDFFQAVNLNHVLLVEIDGKPVYSEERTVYENLGSATDRTLTYLRPSNDEHNHVLFCTVGESTPLHLLVEAQFSQKHASGKHPFEINTTGIPSEFVTKSTPLDNLNSWRALKELDRPADAPEGAQYEQRMVAVLNDYASKIGLTFSVEKMKIGDISTRGIPPQSPRID